MTNGPFPTVGTEQLNSGSWVLDERISETVFTLATVRVEGYTVLYEQPDLREQLGEIVEGGDLPWRFFFATRLTFLPPLAPRIGPMSVFPMVLTESRREFVADLRDRGFEDVNRGHTQRTRTDSGDRVRLTKYTARFETTELDARVEAWFGVWIHNGEFRVAGGAYPVRRIPEMDLTPSNYRDELLSLICNVE
jgi:hypothetical protein